MKINCLSCGHNIDLDDAYADHYEGEIKCYGCDATVEIRTEQSAIRFVRLLDRSAGRVRVDPLLYSGDVGHEAPASNRAK